MNDALNVPHIPDRVERGRSAGSADHVDRHLSAKEFRRWRRAFNFATPELAAHAELVELDLNLLPQLGPHNDGTRALVMKNLASFAAAMAE